MTHLASSTIILFIILNTSFTTTSDTLTKNNRQTRVLMPEQFDMETTADDDLLWRRHPLFPFSRLTTTTIAPTPSSQLRPINWRPGWLGSRPWILPWRSTTTQAPLIAAAPVYVSVPTIGQSPINPIISIGSQISPIAGLDEINNNNNNDSPIIPITISIPTSINITSLPQNTPVKPASTSNICVCVNSTSQCPPQVASISYNNKLRSICKSKQLLCCSNAITTTTTTTESSSSISQQQQQSSTNSSINVQDFSVPSNFIASSCQCLRSVSRCPYSYVALNLVTCPGITCCKPKRPSVVLTPSPATINESCRCVLNENCQTNEKLSKQLSPFCKHPYKLCCSIDSNLIEKPAQGIVSEDTEIVSLPIATVTTPSPLPPNKNCTCVKSASLCPPQADILFDINLIDIRNALFCPKPNLICCIEAELESTSQQNINPDNLDTEIISQADIPVQSITTPSPLPPNKNCTCVKSISQCPPEADVLFDINLIDIRNSFYCSKPNLICCISNEAIESVTETDAPVQSMTITTISQLPPNKNCSCVKSASQCPPHADILYDINLIDIRNSIYCAKPNLICCIALQLLIDTGNKPSNIENENISQSNVPVQAIKPPSTLPVNKNCTCVKTLSQCPPQADVLFDVNLSDFKNKFYCPKPNLICCISIQTSEVETTTTQMKPPESIEIENTSQSDTEISPVTESQESPLPPNKSCRCVKTASHCPPHADLIFDLHLIDVRKDINCPRPNLICCFSSQASEIESTSQLSVTGVTSQTDASLISQIATLATVIINSPIKPIKNITNEDKCTCMDSSKLCPIDNLVIPEFIGVKCGRPRVWCCKQEVTNVVQPGAWCHCTDSCKKHRMRDNGISQSICGSKTLCCEDASTSKPSTSVTVNKPITSVTVKPLNKCIFPRIFPAEGSCVCSERYLCNEESGAFISEVATMCPKSMISCCRALRQCGVSPRSQDIPWLAAVVTNKRELLCSAIIVHRLAVLVPTSCVLGQALSSLMVQVGVGSTACGLNIGVIVPHGDLTLVLLQDYPTTTAQYFSPVCLPPSIANFTSSIDPDNCLVVSLVANRSSRGLMIRQEAVILTEKTECNAVNVLQKPNEICMKNKIEPQMDHQCAGSWGAAVVCRTNDVNHPLTLVGLQTRLRNNCARSASLLTTTHSDTWLEETLQYLSNQCTVH